MLSQNAILKELCCLKQEIREKEGDKAVAAVVRSR